MRRKRGGGGCLRCCSFSVNRKGGTPMFVSFTLRGVCSFFFVLLSVFLCCSVFDLLSSIAPVFCACFPAPVFLFIVVRCLSNCRLALSSLFLVFPGGLLIVLTLLSLYSLCPVLSCLFLCFAYFAASLCCLYFSSPEVYLSFLSLPLALVCFVFSLHSAPLPPRAWYFDVVGGLRVAVMGWAITTG